MAILTNWLDFAQNTKKCVLNVYNLLANPKTTKTVKHMWHNGT